MHIILFIYILTHTHTHTHTHIGLLLICLKLLTLLHSWTQPHCIRNYRCRWNWITSDHFVIKCCCDCERHHLGGINQEPVVCFTIMSSVRSRHLKERQGQRKSLVVKHKIWFILVALSLFWVLARGGETPHRPTLQTRSWKKKQKRPEGKGEAKKNEAQTASQAGLQVELSTFSFLAQCSMTTRWDEQQRLVWAAASWVGNSKHWGPSVYMFTDVYGSHLSGCSPAAAGSSGLLPFSRRPTMEASSSACVTRNGWFD